MIYHIARQMHRLTGQVCALLLASLLCAEIVIVLLRYVYGIGFLQLQDLATYCFGALLVLSVPYALVGDAHVRVDVFRERQSEQLRRQIDRLAVVLLLLPVFIMILWTSWPDISYAWQIFEGSKETGGLPGLFIVKTSVPISCLLMIIQGLALLRADDQLDREKTS